ncbi:hypothetical protein PoB_004166600 [Plakobranchus ocellatus]|uniref:Ig-like domain-containing protein n=1 Tax=Plakobranchus ocellatus TaxID=259542 RepID=A0AAV4AVM5_9GAST|nr:hypothetical protein PoB_004166600 [Plakobranchus ocellatus]
MWSSEIKFIATTNWTGGKISCVSDLSKSDPSPYYANVQTYLFTTHYPRSVWLYTSQDIRVEPKIKLSPYVVKSNQNATVNCTFHNDKSKSIIWVIEWRKGGLALMIDENGALYEYKQNRQGQTQWNLRALGNPVSPTKSDNLTTSDNRCRSEISKRKAMAKDTF